LPDTLWYRELLLPRYPRLTPREPSQKPWAGNICALDTEGTAKLGTFTATAQWDEDGSTPSDRFTDPDDFADFLIEQSRRSGPSLMYFHNLEWDLGVMMSWLGKTTRLRYESHTARRNGSALFAIFDYEGRPKHARKIMLRDSFAIWPHSLAELGKIIGLPKLRTPRKFLPTVLDAVTGAEIDNPGDFDDAPLCDLHGRAECWLCYDLRDVAILHKAMWLYVDECNAAGMRPSLTRSAHAMKEWRTLYLPEPLMQYTERENLRALESRHGGRSQVLHFARPTLREDDYDLGERHDALTTELEGVKAAIAWAEARLETVAGVADGSGWDSEDERVNVKRELRDLRADATELRRSIREAASDIKAATIYDGPYVAADDEIIVQADVNSEYPYVMSQGGFPNAAMHHVIKRPALSALDRYTGWAWATVSLPLLPLGPLLWQDEHTGRIHYPVGQTIQGCWTTEELAYARSLGAGIEMAVLEGTPNAFTLDPFSHYIHDKWDKRAAYKAAGDPRSESEKLSMNGLSGKFGMRWVDPIVRFRAVTDPDVYQKISDAWCERADELPHRYPDFIMIPWNALIMARGRLLLHRFGMTLVEHGATLLACDTDSWTFSIARSELARLPDIGKGLGQWKIENPAAVFYGAAPKEYALYSSFADWLAHKPSKYRAKGIGSTPDRQRAVDHYLRDGDVWFQRPQKTRGVLRGATAATFLPVHKQRRPRTPDPTRILSTDWPAEVARRRLAVNSATLWAKRQDRNRPVTAVVAGKA